ncbi:MAG: hypothetical protein AAF184_15545 [Pseudomonadota bacterium]
MSHDAKAVRRHSPLAAAATAVCLSLSSPIALAAPPHELIKATVPHSLSEARQALVALVPDAEPLTQHGRDRRRVPLATEVPGPPMICIRSANSPYANLFKRRRCMTLTEFERERRLAVLRGRTVISMSSVMTLP